MKPRKPPDRMSHLEKVVRDRMGIREPKPKKKRHRIDRILDEIEAGIAELERKIQAMNQKK